VRFCISSDLCPEPCFSASRILNVALLPSAGNVNHISDLSRIYVSAATVQYNAVCLWRSTTVQACVILHPDYRPFLQAATLTPNATSKLIDGEFVGVAINNPGFKRGDMIAMYLASADFTMTAPLKWTYCEPYLPGYETTGKATAVFQVYNVRAPIMFVLFSGARTEARGSRNLTSNIAMKPLVVGASVMLRRRREGACYHRTDSPAHVC
jgi:hypothetical protein